MKILTHRLVRAVVTPAFCLGSVNIAFGFDVFSVGGTDRSSSIRGTIDSFRAGLGGSNNANTPGPLAGGRREINWDGGGANMTTRP
jgi:hypothetical protein